MANKYLSVSLGTRNWNDNTGTWVTSNGGTTPTTAPTTSDTAFLTSLSGNVTCTTATDTCGIFTGTGYAGTLTINASCKLQVNAGFTISATTTLTNNGSISWGTGSTAGTLTTGITIPGAFTFNGTTATQTLGSNATFSGIVSFTAQSTINGNAVYFQAGVVGANYISGTTAIYLQGGTVSSKFATTNVYLDGDITLKAGTTTFSYVGFGYINNATTVTWLSGTLTSTTSYIEINGNVTFNTGSDVLFDKLYFFATNNQTYTLSDDLYVKDLMLAGNQGGIYTTAGAYSIKVSGSVYSYTTNTFYSSILTGTAKLEMVGTGTLGIARNFAGSSSTKPITYIGLDIDINTAGTMTFGNIGLSENKTLTYTTGTIAATGTINIVGVYTLSADLTYPNVVIGEADKGTSTSTYDPYVLNITTDTTIDNLTINHNSELYITDTKTIDITTSFTTRGTYMVNIIILSTGTGYINYTGTVGNMNIVRTDFTNINATNQLVTFKGVVTTSTNIYSVDYEDISAPKITILEV